MNKSLNNKCNLSTCCYNYNSGAWRMNKTFWIYLILCVIISLLMSHIGYRYDTWQYWVSLACVIGAFQCGRFDERNIKCKECKCRAKEMQAEIDELRDDNIALVNKIVELQS